MAQSQIVILSDNGVSRMLADKAVRNQVFRKQLLGYDTNKNLRVIIQAITTTRQKIADQAGLKAPSWVNGKPRDLNEYLNRSQISRGLCSKVLKEEGSEVTSVEDHHKWGWVVSLQCAVQYMETHL